MDIASPYCGGKRYDVDCNCHMKEKGVTKCKCPLSFIKPKENETTNKGSNATNRR